MYISNASSTVAPTTTQQLILPNDATTTMSSSTEDFGQHVTSTTPTTTTTTTTITANSNIDSKSIISKSISMCFGCGNQITDQYILRVAPDLEWHAKCLKCFECGQFLDENCTCFVRNGKTYCKIDYFRLFSRKCSKCKNGFTKNDLVMRANNRIYHVDCFRCSVCNKQLAPGDEFALRPEEGLLCKLDNDLFEKHSSVHHLNVASTTNNTCQNITNLQPSTMSNGINGKMGLKCGGLGAGSQQDDPNEFEDTQNCLSPNMAHHLGPRIAGIGLHTGSLNQNGHMNPSPSSQRLPNSNSSGALNPNNISSSSSTSSTSSSSSTSSQSSSNSVNGGANTQVHMGHHHPSGGGGGGNGGGGGGSHRKDKTTRVRTVLNEKQLHTLRTCYGANPRPDALMKEQLVEMTGLSPRVIRVWFQNKRCKDKKKTILIKQMQEQQKNRQTIGNGIPMIATSPVRNDINSLGPGSQVEMQQTTQAYHHQSSNASALAWKQQLSEFGLADMGSHHHPMGSYEMAGGGFGSDEEDCFDQMSDQGGDDSASSVGGLDDTRIQQL